MTRTNTMEYVRSREELVRLVDDLKHHAKTKPYLDGDEMFLDFHHHLNVFIKRWGLDSDPHNYATMPEEDSEP
jgi:hypothetical protein